MARGFAVPLILTEAERAELMRLSRSGPADDALGDRARIVLLAAAGLKNVDIAARLRLCAHTVGRWRSLFAANRLEGLRDQCRHTPAEQVRDRFILSARPMV